MNLHCEHLTPRLTCAADWHNADLACDVDQSGLVDPADALVVINAINDHGARLLSAMEKSPSAPLLDVNQDDWISPVDALLVINLLIRISQPATLAASASASDDPNFNGVVTAGRFELLGQAVPGARVAIRAEHRVDYSSSVVWQGMVDPGGAFRVDLAIEPGANEISVEAQDELGRKVSLTKTWYRGDVVADWNAAMLNAIRDWTGLSNDPYPGRIVPSPPPVVARNLAMVHTAMFDALNAVEGRYTPYLSGLLQDSQASGIAALATAAHRVASRLYSDRDETPVWDATLAASLALVPDGDAKDRGIRLGEAVANALLAARQSDGASAKVSYTPSTLLGHWNRTSPDFTPPLLPQWPYVTPFAVDSIAALRPALPPALDSAEYAAAVDEVVRLGGQNRTERTADETAIATFWADGAGTATPPGHWNRIATDLLMTDGHDLLEHARTLALLNLALADAGIAAWDAKYHYDVWRPVDAIRRAAEDGNPSTVPDATWAPLLKTPAFPSYVSGHSTFSAAAAAVLTELLGDNVSFASTTDPQSGLTQRPLAPELITTRSFASFSQAAEEAGRSRIYGGIHYAFDNTAGLELGEAIGNAVIAQWLRPVVADH